jgi:hypothetical protein
VALGGGRKLARAITLTRFTGTRIICVRLNVLSVLKGRPVDKILTIAEIQSQFDSEWVLLEDPQTNSALEVQGGKVIWHSKDRDEVYRKAVELRPKRFATLYLGKMPENTAILL